MAKSITFTITITESEVEEFLKKPGAEILTESQVMLREAEYQFASGGGYDHDPIRAAVFDILKRRVLDTIGGFLKDTRKRSKSRIADYDKLNKRYPIFTDD